MSTGGLIIGSIEDPHVKAVHETCEAYWSRPTLIDAASLTSLDWELRGPDLNLCISGEQINGKGWLRRLAPPLTHFGIEIGTQAAVEAAAHLAFLSALSGSSIAWLTDYWSAIRAENKLLQYRTAWSINVPVPQFEVVSHPSQITPELGEKFIVKPLGLGEYRTATETFAVHSNVLSRGDKRLLGLKEAPFLLQALVDSRVHLRIVTVGTSAWTAQLDAQEFSVDWRLDPAAHESWVATSRPEVERHAIAIARALGIGFSSQDWIIDASGDAWFIDGNPTGQWLFLPAETSEPVTLAIGSWLSSNDVSI